MLDALDRHDWQALEDAYGPAVDVPDQLRALAESEDWEAALDALYAGIFHQGSYYSATPVAVGFLVELLATEATQNKHAIALFLSAMTASHTLDAPESFDPYVFRSSPPLPNYPEGIATIEAIERGADVYVALLAHSDARVRSAAAHLCAGVRRTHERAARLLGPGLSAESNAGVRASFALYASRLPQARELLTPCLTASHRFVRAAATVGWVRAGQAADAELVDLLVDASIDNGSEEPFYWGGEGGLAAMACFALASGAARGAACEALRAVLERRLARGERPLDRMAMAMAAFDAAVPEPSRDQIIADAVLRAVAGLLAPLVFGPLAERREPARLSDLSPEQRNLLALAAHHELPLPVAAVPWIQPATLQRFLSDGAGPLERELTMNQDSDATWRWLYRASEAQTQEAAIQAVLTQRSTCEILALCLDLLSGAYAHPRGGGLCLAFECWTPLLERITRDAAQLESELSIQAQRYEAPDARLAELLVRPLFALARARGQGLGAELDPLLRDALYSRDSAFVRELLGSLPIARRSQLVGRLLNVPLQLRLIDLCDPEALLDATLDELAKQKPSDHRVRHQLTKLFEVERLRAKRAQVHGESRRMLDAVLAELEALEHALVGRSAGGVLTAQWRAADGTLQAQAELPAVPKLSDLQCLFGERALPDVLRIQLDPPDRTLGYRLQRLLSELGIGTVHFGGSSLSTRVRSR